MNFVIYPFQIQIHTSSEWESLYKVVPQELLPSDFGGKDQSMDQLHGKDNRRKNQPLKIEI